MALMPVAGILVKKVQPKHLIFVGFLSVCFAMWHLAGFDSTASFKSIAIARVFQAAGFAFLFVPIQTLAYSNLPPGKSNKGSALINLMRNLGGSVGISMVTTLLARRTQIHQHDLVAHFTSTAPLFQAQLHALANRFVANGVDSVAANKQAIATVTRAMQGQATMLSYLDVFVILTLASLIAAAMTAFLKTTKLGKAPAGH
jgi:DHA2 family multidrug resistance protein